LCTEATIMSPSVLRTLRGVDIPVEIVGSMDDLAVQNDEFEGFEERPVEISTKIMAIELSTDMIRSIVIMDVPTTKLPNVSQYDEDALAPTIKMRIPRPTKAGEAAKTSQPVTSSSQVQLIEFMNAPTIKLPSIKKPTKPLSSKKTNSSSPKKMQMERIHTEEYQSIMKKSQSMEEKEEVNM
jgi:hypothetical protein